MSTGQAVQDNQFVTMADDDLDTLHQVVENLHCPSCIHKIESTLSVEPAIISARVNLTTKRLAVQSRHGELTPERLTAILDRIGYKATPIRADLMAKNKRDEDKALLKALGVAGFAAANVMLMSVSVWSGETSMGIATRDLMYWISALIALPAIAYAGRPFFTSALAALRNRHMNMDVPISLAVLLAAGMSIIQTLQSAEHVYFDAAVMLLFFLLIGRYLDRRVRTRARSVAENLLALRAHAASVVADDGTTSLLPVETLRVGMTVAVAPGERIPVDGIIKSGRSDIDTSLVTGETLPHAVAGGSRVFAGTLNINGALQVTIDAVDEDTLLAEIVRLMEAAEQGRARYVRLADRAARIYAPTVHILSALTFLGWFFILDIGWQGALMNAIAVLIITCPCALGLAVPAVQVVASGLLLARGILLKSADGLEKLAAIDYVVFDKTGTLTLGTPELVNEAEISRQDIAVAAQLAAASKHPLARALCHVAGPVETLDEVREEPGMGLEAMVGGQKLRLGNRIWCNIDDQAETSAASELWLAGEGRKPAKFAFADQPRSDAADVVRRFKQAGVPVELLSGDRPSVVTATAHDLGIDIARGGMKPDDKIARLKALADEGHKVLMVGDGLNDAPALAAAFASVSPSTAADVSQTVADLVFQGDELMPVVYAWRIARKAHRLIMQNFGLSLGYNVIAVPVAVLGLVTPLIAALAMSASSLVVTLNAFRLQLARIKSK